MKNNNRIKLKEVLLLISLIFVLFLESAFAQVEFIGNVHSFYDDPNFTSYWNQVTPENAGKWYNCEPTRDEYDWSSLDQAYHFAKSNGLVFKEHTFVWGNQYPSWMDNLSQVEQRAEVEEWIKDFGERYPNCDYIDVVNEPLPGHNPAPFSAALGGAGETGWDWVVTSFEWARQYCPNAKLILNDFGIINSAWAAGELAKIATILNERGLIDGIGLQCHAFSMNDASTDIINEVLDILSVTGLPIYITELDMGGDDLSQLNRYMEKFPVLWNHGNVKGVTLWGYREGQMWIPDAWLYNDNTNTERLALTWLKSFVADSDTALVIPGRIEAEAYRRQIGVDTLYVNDTIVLVNQIGHLDWTEYVLDALDSEEYNVDIKISNPVNNSRVFIIVDGMFTDTLLVSSTDDKIQTSIFLDKGKHSMKLLFSNAESEENLMEIDWMDIYGQIKYFTIEASSDESGSIMPKGTVYVAQGDSVSFSIDANPGYKPDSVFVDGIKRNATLKYTFNNVTENGHTIVAKFAACNGVELDSYFKINDNEFISGFEFAAYEQDNVILKVGYTEKGNFYWLDNEGTQSIESEFIINDIEMSHKGIYGFYHIGDDGCKSNVNFDISVDYMVLDVYQAEDFESQKGIQTEDAIDIGAGKNIGYIENSDWCTYTINIEEAGVYDFVARAATETSGGSIEISQADEILGTLKIEGSKTNGWQDWYTTEPVKVKFEQAGEQEIKLTFKGGGDYLFNLNWFDLSYKKPLSVNSNVNDFKLPVVYPNPVKNTLTIEAEFDITAIDIYNSQGQKVQSQETVGTKHHIEVDLPKGIYMLTIYSENIPIKQKFVIE